MYISKELVTAIIILIFVILLFIIVIIGGVFYGAGYDAGLKTGIELSGRKYPQRNRDTILKFDLKDKFAKER